MVSVRSTISYVESWCYDAPQEWDFDSGLGTGGKCRRASEPEHALPVRDKRQCARVLNIDLDYFLPGPLAGVRDCAIVRYRDVSQLLSLCIR